MISASSAETSPPTIKARVMAAPCGAESRACTARASSSRSFSTLPVSGTWMCATAALAIACLMTSTLFPHRR
jgi:hypothetical protein